MYRTLRPTLAGIEIRVTLAWLLIAVALVGTSLSAVYVPAFGDEPRDVQILSIALLGVALPLSLALHEAAHVVVARRLGSAIAAVSPQLAGALPDTLYEADSPSDEARVGVAGPVASALIAAMFGGVWWLTRDVIPAPVSSVVGLVALANLGLAIVSLMPGYPFDGGRVARGFFWYLTGDLFTATKVVGYIGYVIIMALMAVGVLFVVGGGNMAIWGFWILMTAFMVNRSVGAGISHIFWTVTSRRLRVDDLYVGGTRRIDGGTSLDDAVERLLEGYRDGPMLVFEDGVATGFVDLASIRPIPRHLWTERRVRDVCSPLGDLPRVPSTAALTELIDRLPPDVPAVALITRDDRVIGATDRADVIQRLQDYLAAERIEQMRRGR